MTDYLIIERSYLSACMDHMESGYGVLSSNGPLEKKKPWKAKGPHLQAITWASLVVPEYLRNRYLGILVLILSLIGLHTSDPTLINESRDL